MQHADDDEVFEPPHPWIVQEDGCDRDALGRIESVFALANGHLGLRGNLDEGEPRELSGTYLNGFYESYPLEYGERGFGFAEDGQVVVNVPDGKIIRLLVENEPVDIERGRVISHRRALDLRTGILSRELDWCSAYEHRIRVRTKRLVSFTQRSVAAIHYEVEAVDGPLRVALQSVLVGNQAENAEADDPRAGRALGTVLEPKIAVGRGHRAVMAHTTRRTQLSVASGVDHLIEDESGLRITNDVEEDLARLTISARLEPGKPLRLVKFLAYHWSSRQTVEWLRDQVDASLENALAEGWDGLERQQREFLDDFWTRADIELEGDVRIQQALRFSLFHVLQAGARIEGRAIGAKGLTGNGYDGHTFWDTESFVLPVLTYVEPRAARDALAWRHSILPMAVERARTLSLDGASFPWRTIRGEDCSGYWPAGLAAVHVNADVADAVRRYIHVTGDTDFERDYGVELLAQTARLWISLGSHDLHGFFRISGVTGPDEYTAIVDDNVYTNLMAESNLRAAAAAAERHPEVAERLGVDDAEIAGWIAAADAVFVPYDPERGLHPQDASFLDHGVWDFASTGPEQYPLLLHHPYFEIYRRQVVKQADLVLALWFRGDRFSDEEKRRNFEYYEGVTVRDSSLSACAQAVIAAEVGHLDLAWEYLRESALIDFEDIHANSTGGVHLASLSGAVLSAICGFGGFRDHDGSLRFKPRLPEQVERLRFRLTVRGTRLCVTVGREEATYETEAGDPLTIAHWDEELEVGPDPVSRPVPPIPDLDPPVQPPHRAPGVGQFEVESARNDEAAG